LSQAECLLRRRRNARDRLNCPRTSRLAGRVPSQRRGRASCVVALSP
jgi:hypothetical protein